MKRFINKARSVIIEPLNVNFERKFKLTSGQTFNPDLSENEILVGSHSGNTYLFIYQNGELFSYSHDDFSYDFLRIEEINLDSALSTVTSNISTLNTNNKLVVEDEGGVV
jgi:hypothetical protein